MAPSEWYLIEQRKVLFRDEWLFYGLLALLFFTDHCYMLGIIAVIGGIFVLNSYRRQWEMEASRFEPCSCQEAPDPNVD